MNLKTLNKVLDVICKILYLVIIILFTYRINVNTERIEALENVKHKTDTVYIVKEKKPDSLSSSTPDIHLMDALEYYNVQHKDTVYAQAILETGHFQSRVCKEDNNLFGLYNSSTKQYYKFKHWSESVIAYLKYIQYRYNPPNNYYNFLDNIGYAEDPEYISKVKWLVDNKK